MKGLKLLVIIMGVMIFVATSALVVLVVKKHNRQMTGTVDMVGTSESTNNSPYKTTDIKGRYITSYAVGDALAVVSQQPGGGTAIILLDPKTLRTLSRLVVTP